MYTKTNGGDSYFVLYALPVFFIKCCHKLCIQRQMVVQWKYVSYLLYEKYLKLDFFYSLSTLTLHWIKLENFAMQLKRQSVEAWQNEKHYSKENNTSDNPILRREIFESGDNVKYEGQVRSGQVTAFVVCAVFLLKFQAVVLPYENCWGELMDSRNSNGIELRNFYFTTV